MTRISFGPLFHTTLGFERMLDEVEKLLESEVKTQPSFPPHNIIKLDDNRYIIELAVAGFGRDEIDITVNDNKVVIKGERKDKDTSVQYLHRGIGGRSFTKEISIADTIEVRGAEFKDGILRVGLENIIPDHKKPRKIEIGNEIPEFRPQLLRE